MFPDVPLTGTPSSGFLADVRNRGGSDPGLTDCYSSLGCESEVSALRFSTYFFAENVNEMTLPSRPASPDAATHVETDHPHV